MRRVRVPRPGLLGRQVRLQPPPPRVRQITSSHLPHMGIQTRNVCPLQTHPRLQDIGEVDFAYSMGLFDYLQPKAAVRMLSAMASTVRPGGRLLVGQIEDAAPNLG